MQWGGLCTEATRLSRYKEEIKHVEEESTRSNGQADDETLGEKCDPDIRDFVSETEFENWNDTWLLRNRRACALPNLTLERMPLTTRDFTFH